MRAFFAGGVDKMHVPWVVEALPALVHLSLFLFFAGLIIFLLHINHNVSVSVIWWIGLFSTLYGCITFMPMFLPDSPYYTPLSTPAAFMLIFFQRIIAGVFIVVLVLCVWIGLILFAMTTILSYFFFCFWYIPYPCRTQNLPVSDRRRLRERGDGGPDNYMRTCLVLSPYFSVIWGWLTYLPKHIVALVKYIWYAFPRWTHRLWKIGEVAGNITSDTDNSSEIDLGILDWTIGAFGEDHDDKLARLFEAIPGFFNSKLVSVPKVDSRHQPTLHSGLRTALDGFLRRTLSSNLVSESVVNHRLEVYLNSNSATFKPDEVSRTVSHIFVGHFGQLPQSIETARVLAHWYAANNEDIASVSRCLLARILQTIQERDDRWIALARDHLSFSEHVLRGNIACVDDSLKFCILIHMTRHTICTQLRNRSLLSSLSQFGVHNTVPKLQNEFCALWNEIVLKERSYHTNYPVLVLREIRHVYLALHQGTDAAPTAFDDSTADNDAVLGDRSSYPLCNIAAHRCTRHSNSTVPPIQLEDPSDTSPYPARPGDDAAPQQSKEANIAPGRLSSSDYGPPYARGLPSSSPSAASDHVHILPQVVSVMDPSIHEFTEAVALDLNPCLLAVVSHRSRRSAQSSVDYTTNIVHPNEPTSSVLTSGVGEPSQTSEATPLTFPPSDPVLVTANPPNLPVSVQPGDFPMTP